MTVVLILYGVSIRVRHVVGVILDYFVHFTVSISLELRYHSCSQVNVIIVSMTVTSGDPVG